MSKLSKALEIGLIGTVSLGGLLFAGKYYHNNKNTTTTSTNNDDDIINTTNEQLPIIDEHEHELNEIDEIDENMNENDEISSNFKATILKFTNRSKSIYFGCGSIQKFDRIILEPFMNKENENDEKRNEKKRKKVLIIAGRTGYKKNDLWGIIKRQLNLYNFQYVLFDKTRGNPTSFMVENAAEIGRKRGCEFVISIGGSSSHDVSKIVAILLHKENKGVVRAKDLCCNQESNSVLRSVPVICINTVHSNGSECNKCAIVQTSENNRSVFMNQTSVPLFSINDPLLMISLSKKNTFSSGIQCLILGVEYFTHGNAGKSCRINLIKEAVKCVAKYLPIAIKQPKNIEARYFLNYASLSVGISVKSALLIHLNSVCAFTFCRMCKFDDLTYGESLAIFFPSVIKELYKYQYGKILSNLLKPLVKGEYKGDEKEADEFAKEIEKWVFSLGFGKKLVDYGIEIDNAIDCNKFIKISRNYNRMLEGCSLFRRGNKRKKEEIIRNIFLSSLTPLV